MAVKKGNSKVLEAINKGLEKVLKTDAYAQIEAKWLR